MTREQAKALAPVIAGYAEGKVVQWWSEEQGRWKDFNEGETPNLCNVHDRYRCKPAPMRVWLNIYPNGAAQVYSTAASAKLAAGSTCLRSAVEFIEVEDGA